MTKVQLQYDLARPLDETLMQQVSAATALFGLLRVRVADSLRHLTVDYDASRLTVDQVEAALQRAGLPIQRRA
jgi:hypothetical protein